MEKQNAGKIKWNNKIATKGERWFWYNKRKQNKWTLGLVEGWDSLKE